MDNYNIPAGMPYKCYGKFKETGRTHLKSQEPIITFCKSPQLTKIANGFRAKRKNKHLKAHEKLILLMDSWIELRKEECKFTMTLETAEHLDDLVRYIKRHAERLKLK